MVRHAAKEQKQNGRGGGVTFACHCSRLSEENPSRKKKRYAALYYSHAAAVICEHRGREGRREGAMPSCQHTRLAAAKEGRKE